MHLSRELGIVLVQDLSFAVILLHSWITIIFELLRVLYIPNANSCHYHPEMFRLIHLRVLVIGGTSDTNISLIMAKIHKFRNLECFIMSINLLLEKICKMEVIFLSSTAVKVKRSGKILLRFVIWESFTI